MARDITDQPTLQPLQLLPFLLSVFLYACTHFSLDTLSLFAPLSLFLSHLLYVCVCVYCRYFSCFDIYCIFIVIVDSFQPSYLPPILLESSPPPSPSHPPPVSSSSSFFSCSSSSSSSCSSSTRPYSCPPLFFIAPFFPFYVAIKDINALAISQL